MTPEDPIQDDPVIRRVAAARPQVPADDVSPDGRRARAIKDRVLSSSVSAQPVTKRRQLRHRRWVGPLRTGLGAAAVIAPVVLVVVVILIAAGSHARHRVSAPTTPHPVVGSPPPAPASLLPAHGGMRGVLSMPQLTGSGSDLTAIFGQCPSCRGRSHGKATLWRSRSVDRGRSWRTERVSTPKTADLGMAAQAGDAIWTTGNLGEATPAIFVSHDGRRYTAAATAATPAADSPLTISDGTVWALGNRCDGHACRAIVLSGPAGGDRLTATESQPGLSPHVNGVQAVIGAHGSTVVITSGFSASELQAYVSHDAGRSWSQVSYPCRRPVEGDIYPTSAESLWAVCLGIEPSTEHAHHGTDAPASTTPRDIIRRSSDGGRHWTTVSTLALEQPTLSAVTDEVAWIMSLNGTVKRTTDGGLTWQTVLRTQAGAELLAQDAQTATVVVSASRNSSDDHRRRTNLVSYRTSDGGARWTPTLIKLPTG